MRSRRGLAREIEVFQGALFGERVDFEHLVDEGEGFGVGDAGGETARFFVRFEADGAEILRSSAS